MATRPSPRSDARLREQYRRGKRRSARAQEIARDLEDGDGIDPIALGRWNRGEDPALRAMSEANNAVSARGFSAAAADRGRAMQAVNRALQAEPDSNLPPVAREMYERMQNRLTGNAEEFLRDADEYSGRRARNYNISAPSRRDKQAEEAEKAVQRQGLSAEDYWDRNPDARRTATVRTRSATRTETVSSDPNSPTVTTSRPANDTVREVDLMDLRAESDRRAKADKTRPNMEKFNATAPEREKLVAGRRKQNEEAGAQKFAKFVADNEIDKRKVAQAESFLRTYRQKAANYAQAATEAALDGRERSGEFWSEVENARYNSAYLDSVPKEEQLQWALEQLEEEEKSRASIERAAREKTTQQEPLISAFTGSGGTISELLPGYFSNINIR